MINSDENKDRRLGLNSEVFSMLESKKGHNVNYKMNKGVYIHNFRNLSTLKHFQSVGFGLTLFSTVLSPLYLHMKFLCYKIVGSLGGPTLIFYLVPSLITHHWEEGSNSRKNVGHF